MIDDSSSEIDSKGPAVDLDSSRDEMGAKSHIEMNLKNQLQFYLEMQEISAAQLAKRSGVSKQVLSLWLGGGSPRNVEQVKLVADVFKVTVDHLCFGDGALKHATPATELFESEEWVTGIFELKVRKIKSR